MDSVTMTKQGVRNLNSLGPKKKRPEAAKAEPEGSAAEPVKAPDKETTDKDVVPAG